MGRRRKLKKRHPNGSVVRTGPAVERDTKAVGEEARMRQYGLSKEDAGRVEAATAIGRLRLRCYEGNDRSGDLDIPAGKIGTPILSAAQYEAAQQYLRVVQAYQRAISSPAPLGSAGDLERARGHDNEDGTDEAYVKRCRIARDQYRLARGALLDRSPAVYVAVQSWVVHDQECRFNISDLIVGLNVLRAVFRVQEREAA